MRTWYSEVSPQWLIVTPYKLHIKGFIYWAELGDLRSEADLSTPFYLTYSSSLRSIYFVISQIISKSYLLIHVTTAFPLASTYSALWKLDWILSGLCKVSSILGHIRDDEWDGVYRFLLICVCFAQFSHIRALTNVLWLNWADGFVIKMSLSQNKFLWLFSTLHLCVGIYICFSVYFLDVCVWEATYNCNLIL